ncbi:MAG: type II toxin-antitoxin system RelE/ParE family toxin [Spirochaetes bacterium]|nr:type II toxin-antitoxin system RelE/ParE family toxin [Spirochaetota bacterium]
MSDKFRIAETDNFKKKIADRDFSHLYGKIRDFIYPQLRKNPFFGPNIKKLKEEFAGVYRYRIGSFRLFYSIDSDKIIVFIIDIEKRKDSY